jgi:hypothetical protein
MKAARTKKEKTMLRITRYCGEKILLSGVINGVLTVIMCNDAQMKQFGTPTVLRLERDNCATAFFPIYSDRPNQLIQGVEFIRIESYSGQTLFMFDLPADKLKAVRPELTNKARNL